LHDNRVALDELALVDVNPLSSLFQHDQPFRL
jgi:hypothetical protein